MDQQVIVLLAEIRDALQQIKERDDAWLEEIRQRDKATEKRSRQIENRYIQWRKEDLARIKRNEDLAQRNYEMAAQLYTQQLEKAYWIGLDEKAEKGGTNAAASEQNGDATTPAI